MNGEYDARPVEQKYVCSRAKNSKVGTLSVTDHITLSQPATSIIKKHDDNMNPVRSNQSALAIGGSVAVIGVGMLVWWRLRLTDRDVIQRSFWDKVYDQCSVLYDCVDWFTWNTTQRLRLRALDYIPRNQDISILEVGFGTGLLHLELAKLPHKQLAGLDLAPGMVKLSQKRLGAKESDLRVGDVTKGLPWENESFDVVLSTFVLSAISDTTAAISEMVRVLKPGGKLIIVDAGAAQDEPRRVSRFLAVLWELLGDYMRDDAELLLSHADMVSATREDYGPWKCVHVTVGEKKGSTS